MPNPPFQPLTLSVEEWQRIWTTQVESRDEGLNRIVKLRAECEAQAQAAASLQSLIDRVWIAVRGNELDAYREGKFDLDQAVASLRHRLEEANADGENLHAKYRELSAQLEQAQKELAKESDDYAMDLAVIQDAMRREQSANQRASQAEAALEEMQKHVLGTHEGGRRDVRAQAEQT